MQWLLKNNLYDSEKSNQQQSTSLLKVVFRNLVNCVYVFFFTFKKQYTKNYVKQMQ